MKIRSYLLWPQWLLASMLVQELEPLVPIVDPGVVRHFVLKDALARGHVQLEVIGGHPDGFALLAAVELGVHGPENGTVKVGGTVKDKII